MCNPTPPAGPRGTDRDLEGHSRAAHRRHGWCAECHGRTTVEELVAWRAVENRREEATQAALDASERNPSTVHLTSENERPCPVCGREAMTAVTVHYALHNGTARPIGGWAVCSSCDATPHPTMPAPDQEDADHG